MRGFLFDVNRCTGCHACLLACAVENGLEPGSSWRAVFSYNASGLPGIARYHLSFGCLHCAEPACMIHCPSRAYSRHLSTGAVLLDPALCIGCRYCSWACPFDAPKYCRATGTMSKCTFCNGRLIDGQAPACCALCPTGALQFAGLGPDAGIEVPAGFPQTGLGPAIRFRLPRSSSGPEMDHGLREHAESSADLPHPVASTKLSIESDWSLIAFTLAACLLAAMAGAAMTGSVRPGAFDFLAAGLGALGVSALHLGRSARAWRSLLNLRRSWLSREIAAYVLFLALYTASALVPAAQRLLGWAALLAGFTCLYAIDRVYGSVSGRAYPVLHSGSAVLTGLFLYGVIAHSGAAAAATGLAKLVLYAERQPWARGRWRAWAAALRLSAGFVLPIAFWSEFPAWILPPALAGEVIDRCEYYLDLEIPSPAGRMASDLEIAVRDRARNQTGSDAF
jgi:Fe-S-cluster-containing dehydrogenase component